MISALFFSISKLRSSNKPMTEREAREFIKRKSPVKKIKLVITDDFLNSYYAYYNNTISLSKGDLYEEILLHELGHAVKMRDTKSANYKYILKEVQSAPFKTEYLINAEKEAWDWAEDNSDEPFGKRTRMAKFMALRSYKKLPKYMIPSNSESE